VEAIAGGDLSQEVIVAEPLKIPANQISGDEVGLLLKATVGMSEVLSSLDQAFARQSNEELEERAQMLEQQCEQIRAKNREVEETSREVQRKADELEQVSTYKSEFLSNMSHELPDDW
jgi:signal transduction histidine kinase